MADTYTITIAGVAKEIQVGWTITESVNGRSSLECDVFSKHSTYRPAIGAEVIVTENGVPIFGGYVNTPNEAGFSTGITTHISAVDYNVLADRRFVQDGGFPAGWTLKQALTSLVGYLTPYGVTLHASQVNGPTLPLLVYDVRSLTSIFDELSVITGYVWNIGYDKKLRMTDVGELTAPFTITTASHVVDGDVTVEKEREGYANRVIVKAGTGTSEVTDTFTGNGSTTTFALTYRLFSNRGYVTNGGVNETLGIGATWTYDASTNTITRTPAPANLNAISITYIASFPYVATADAGAAPADLVERVYTAPEVFSATVAQTLAAGYLARALDVSKTVQYDTRRLGLHAGQTQTITITERELSGTFLITDVVTNNPTGGRVTRTVTATGGSEYHGSFRDTLRQLGSGSSGSTTSGTVSIMTGGGVGGSGTTGALAQWATISTLGDATAVPAALLTGTIAGARMPAFMGDVASSIGTVALTIQSGVIANAMVNAAAAIAWSKLDKTGSSLADLTTRSAGDLSSGNLAYARMPSGSGTWTAIPTISGIATFSSDVVASATVGTSNFASQTTGWRITSAGAADVRNLYTDEFTAKSFIADLEQALAGGQIITKSVAVLASTFTAPAAGAATTLVVEDLPSAPNMAVFVSGDTVVLRSLSRAGGALTISDCVGVVTAYVDG